MQQRNNFDFLRSLLKGKIAEIIFQHMFQVSDTSIVIPFGYEHLTPILAQYQRTMYAKEELENIRNTPDFLLMKPDHTQLRLVDVKYRKTKDTHWTKEIAEKVAKRWPTAWIFLATPQGFYFSSCTDIIANNGEIEPLRGRLMPEKVQEE